jgi:hypothetical protein
VFTAPPGVKYEMLSANIGASDAAQDGRSILLAIAVGIGFPEMFLTADFSNANFASTMVAQSPFVREFEDWQDFFDHYIMELFAIVIRIGIKNGFLDEKTSTEVVNEWPPLTYQDFVAHVTALGQLFQSEVISKDTYASRLDINYDEEKKKIESERIEAAANDYENPELQDPNSPAAAKKKAEQEQSITAGDINESLLVDSDGKKAKVKVEGIKIRVKDVVAALRESGFIVKKRKAAVSAS